MRDLREADRFFSNQFIRSVVGNRAVTTSDTGDGLVMPHKQPSPKSFRLPIASEATTGCRQGMEQQLCDDIAAKGESPPPAACGDAFRPYSNRGARLRGEEQQGVT